MKQKTKQQIVDYIGQNFKLQGVLSRNQRLAVWSIYILQPFIFQIVLLASIAQSQFQFPYSQGFELGLVLTRIAIAILYMYTQWIYIIPSIKILQIANIYMLRTNFSALGLLFQLIAQLIYTAKKEKRYVNFDSRLESKYVGVKLFAIYILLLASFFTSQDQITKSPSSVLFTSIIYYIASCLDSIYSYRTKEILRTLALCPILMAIYFLCQPLVPALNTFGLVAHTVVSVVIVGLIMTYAIVTDYTYHNSLLFKKIINLQSRDKLAYIWALICFVQAPTYNQLVCFIKTHQSKCFNPLCPMNSSITHAAHLQQQVILKSLKLYLKKCLQRFASQSDQIRRLFIYYRQQDDPKITYLLKQNDIFQRIQQQRIVRNLNTVTDPSLEYEQMKEIQEDTFMKVKLFLNHYEYFLSYISKEVIKMETSEEIIDELLKLKAYFLSFKPEKHQDKLHQQQEQQLAQAMSSNKLIKNSQGYQQVSSQTMIPLKKMTVKTVLLVNFMRQVYFNLPSLQKQQFSAKKINYISEDIEQGAIIVISAESYNLGKVMNWNTMTQKVLLFPTKQLRQRYVNDLIPQPLHKQHQEILMRGALRIEMNEPAKQLSTKIFTFTKPSYIVVFETKIVGTNSISGNKWIIHLFQHFDRQCVIVVDQYRNIVGVNKNAVRFGLGLPCVGEQLNEQVYERVIKGKKDKVILAQGVQPVLGVKMDKQTQWWLADTTYALQGMQKYFIVQIQATQQLQKAILSCQKKNKQTALINNVQQNIFPLCENGFEFNFDPYQLKYTNQPIPSHSYSDIQLIWQQNAQIQQRTYSHNLFQEVEQTYQRNKLINFGDNIHQMIYFDKKLQFKENFQVSTEFETHPSYKPGGKMVANNRGLSRININKENFIQNVNKIKRQVPSFVYKMIMLFIVLSLICIICLTLRLVYFNNLYSTVQQQQLISMQVINRKNYIVNVGSLAVYLTMNSSLPGIWNEYLSNGWSFQNLFVSVEYTNGRINNLNSDIGLLVSKGYVVNNGTMKTLANYFQSLSIQASSWTTNSMNLTQFISLIVNDVSSLQHSISLDTQSYYHNQYSTYQHTVLIFDIVQLIICILTFVCMHFLLRKAYMQRVYLFKSLTVIQQQQISKILSTVNQHREYIKNNQLQSIPLDDSYYQTLETQNIKHEKKMFYSYFSSKIVLFYIFIAINVIGAGFIFLLSTHSSDQVQNIQLITPFVSITGQQRYSMVKLYLKTITNMVNTTESDLMTNIHMFQANKKGVIDSLIQQPFSNQFMTYYNSIWFSPCATLAITTQCSSLFSGILSGNLDYNYVYILTEIENVINYRTQIAASNNTQFITDANTEISKSYTRINFLLFQLMVKLQTSFAPNLQSQINYLYKAAENDNLVIFLVSIIWVLILALILAYTLYKIKNLSNQTLQMLTTVVPSYILMRNQYFVEWYQEKFRNVY